MTKKKVRRKSQKPTPLFPMTAGLLLIGFAFVVMASPRSQSNAESLSSVEAVAVNFAAPELSLESLSGRTEALTDYRGSVVLVNNWAMEN